MYSTLAPPEVFFKCAMKIKLIELIVGCSIRGKWMSWCHFKVAESRNVTKQQVFGFFSNSRATHIFLLQEDTRKQNSTKGAFFQWLIYEADAAFGAVWAGQAAACSTASLLPISEGRCCEFWYPAHRETRSCSGRPDTSWTQAGPLEVSSAAFWTCEGAEQGKERECMRSKSKEKFGRK